VAYRKLMDRLNCFRRLMLWLRGAEAPITFQEACEEAGVSMEGAEEAILKDVPESLVNFISDPHAACPLCKRARQ
jgi:hypothetical protein